MRALLSRHLALRIEHGTAWKCRAVNRNGRRCRYDGKCAAVDALSERWALCWTHAKRLQSGRGAFMVEGNSQGLRHFCVLMWQPMLPGM